MRLLHECKCKCDFTHPEWFLQLKNVSYCSFLTTKSKAKLWYCWLIFGTVHVFHLTAPEVLAQLHALTTITEATETPWSVQTLLCTHTRLTLIHIWQVTEQVEEIKEKQRWQSWVTETQRSRSYQSPISGGISQNMNCQGPKNNISPTGMKRKFWCLSCQHIREWKQHLSRVVFDVDWVASPRSIYNRTWPWEGWL